MSARTCEYGLVNRGGKDLVLVGLCAVAMFPVWVYFTDDEDQDMDRLLERQL